MKKRIKKLLGAVAMVVISLSVVTGFAENKDITTYSGGAITPEIQVLSTSGTKLTKDVDYTVTYSNNINVGTATATITFKGNYSGTRTVNFNIVAKQLSNSSVTISETASQTYTGSAITPSPSIKYGDVTLVKDKDYTLSYTDNVNAGKAKINIAFIGNYSGSATQTFEILADALSQDKVTISETASQIYTGSAITPTPTVKYGSVTLVKDKDYTLSYKDNLNVGTAKISIAFIGNYSGSATQAFEIVPDALNQEKVTISETANQTYTGSAITPTPTIKYGDVTLVKDKDYTLSYTDNLNVGTAKINVSFIGNYTGSAGTGFEITARAVSDDDKTVVIQAISDQTYTGKEITPDVVITDKSR